MPVPRMPPHHNCCSSRETRIAARIAWVHENLRGCVGTSHAVLARPAPEGQPHRRRGCPSGSGDVGRPPPTTPPRADDDGRFDVATELSVDRASADRRKPRALAALEDAGVRCPMHAQAPRAAPIGVDPATGPLRPTPAKDLSGLLVHFLLDHRRAQPLSDYSKPQRHARATSRRWKFHPAEAH